MDRAGPVPKAGRTVYHRGRTLRGVFGVEGNQVDVDSGERFWVSGPRRGQGLTAGTATHRCRWTRTSASTRRSWPGGPAKSTGAGVANGTREDKERVTAVCADAI